MNSIRRKAQEIADTEEQKTWDEAQQCMPPGTLPANVCRRHISKAIRWYKGRSK